MPRIFIQSLCFLVLIWICITVRGLFKQFFHGTKLDKGLSRKQKAFSAELYNKEMSPFSQEKIFNSRHPMCKVKCQTGIPCEYLDEIDFRVMVLTYNRPDSLKRTLNSLKSLQMDGGSLSIEIWIDRSKTGHIDYKVKALALDYQRDFDLSLGRVCVHEQSRNAFIVGQWVNTWRPKKNTKEIGLILEDDVDVSPYAYRWLKAVHAMYDKENDVAGVTLQMEDIRFYRGGGQLRGSKGDTVFLYPVLGTWGYSPTANKWREFQDWHKANYNGFNVKPYVPNLILTKWYKIFEKRGTKDTMWEQWHIYFCYVKTYYTVYSNLAWHTGKRNLNLSTNRKVAGLHFKRAERDNSKNLMKLWNDSYIKFPEKIPRLKYGARG